MTAVRLLAALCATAWLVPAAARAQAPLTLDEAVARTLQANPRLMAARLGRAIATESVAVARERPNPELVFESGRDTPHASLSTAWTLETGGKRGRRIGVAESSVKRTDAELARLTAEVAAGARRTFFALVIARRRVSIAADLQQLAGRARDAARDRFQSGAAPRMESLQAEVAFAEAENEATMATGLADAARAELNALMGQPPDTAVVPADDLSAPPLPTVEAAWSRALGASTELAVIDQQIAEGSARVGLARAMQVPDTVANAGMLFDSPPDFQYGWRFGFSLTVPILTRHRAGVRLEEAAVTEFRAEREAAVARIRGAVSAALARAGAERQAFVRYRDDILPRTEEVERMAEDAYRSGQTGLVALLQAFQNARDVRLRALAAASEYQSALTDLEQAIGTSLP